ncbi:winged helix-turn-helix domain-containing protein [Microbacterium sp. G2-8]|uniref:winged helix-turn-helix domain-containing protein n=1 Tax=Microbacterium sp. G2-8 TaxID=2842454 RepID=UPI001C88EB45|nr:crosslink repair DNA glycosylase YcaQ family protein [Microbacterium sp. G2-8]
MARTALSAGEARRTALAAQGFGREREGAANARSLAAAIRRMGVLQIDSVNVFARSHYMPLFSRVGPYDPALLERLVLRRGTAARPASYVEYLAHEAAFMPVDDWPLWGFKRDLMRRRYGGEGSWVADPQGAQVVDKVRAELRERGPLRPSDIESVVRRGGRGPWWDWDHAKQALEMMWRFGDVAIAGREGFERVYALAEHVVPSQVRDVEMPEADAVRELVRRAAIASGIATVADLKDYYRLPSQKGVRAAVDELVDAGELVPVEVEGWRDARDRAIPAWMHRDARVPRRIAHTSLLTPFDPAVWFRDRAERLFDFRYRIEIYVPQPKRQYGYYSLPVLVDDRVVGRIDLKADRQASTLRVQSAWWEEHAASGHAADRIADELLRAAAWQGLEHVSVSRWGDATDHLAGALDAERHAHPNAEGL